MKAIITILLDDDDNVRVITDGEPRDLSAMMETAAAINSDVKASVIYTVGLMLRKISPAMCRAYFEKFQMPLAMKKFKKAS